MEITFYGLLHLAPTEKSAVNVSVKNFDDQLLIYVGCALTLSKSLRSKGLKFVLLTNDRQGILEIANSLGQSIDVEEIPFTTKVPTRARFYSAHHKIDCFRYFSTLKNTYAFLIDLDVICLRQLPLSLKQNIEAGMLISYDISDQVIPAYGADKIRTDLEIIHGVKSEGRWYGGEFMGAPPHLYKRLIDVIDSIYLNYTRKTNLSHQGGEEPLTSAAIELLKLEGVQMVDAGSLGIIGRYWNGSTLHPQKPLKYFLGSFLLHLPSDKRFLAKLSRKSPMETEKFIGLYRSHQRRSYVFRRPAIRIRDLIRRLSSRATWQFSFISRFTPQKSNADPNSPQPLR
jgi:hypothetical protein